MFSKTLNQDMHIGKTLKSLRMGLGYTQKQVEEILPYTCYLSKIECGRTSVPFKTLFDLVYLYNSSLEEFFSLTQHLVHYKEKEINEKFTKDYARMNEQQLYAFIKQIEDHIPVVNSDTNKELLICRLKCFYYLNFKNSFEKANKYADTLCKYLTATTETERIFSLFDIDLCISLFPFLSFEGAEAFFKHATFSLDFWKNLTISSDAKVRLHLMKAKNTLRAKKFDHLASECFTLETLAIESGRLQFIADAYILKGISHMQIARDNNYISSLGPALLQKGLITAHENNLSTMYNNWKPELFIET